MTTPGAVQVVPPALANVTIAPIPLSNFFTYTPQAATTDACADPATTWIPVTDWKPTKAHVKGAVGTVCTYLAQEVQTEYECANAFRDHGSVTFFSGCFQVVSPDENVPFLTPNCWFSTSINRVTYTGDFNYGVPTGFGATTIEPFCRRLSHEEQAANTVCADHGLEDVYNEAE